MSHHARSSVTLKLPWHEEAQVILIYEEAKCSHASGQLQVSTAFDSSQLRHIFVKKWLDDYTLQAFYSCSVAPGQKKTNYFHPNPWPIDSEHLVNNSLSDLFIKYLINQVLKKFTTWILVKIFILWWRKLYVLVFYL